MGSFAAQDESVSWSKTTRLGSALIGSTINNTLGAARWEPTAPWFYHALGLPRRGDLLSSSVAMPALRPPFAGIGFPT
jgi:hypothetical protein